MFAPSISLRGLWLCVAISLLGSVDRVEAQCDPRVFLVQEMKDIRATGETELAFVLTATQEEFDSAKKSGAMSGSYGLISGSANYAEAKERAVKIAQATKFNYRDSYALSYFSQTYSARALQAYESCLRSKSAGLQIWLGSREGDYITFYAIWIPRNLDIPRATFDAPPFVDGGSLVSAPESWSQSKTEQIVVKRAGNNDVLLQLRVGGETSSKIVVRDPPQVIWETQPVVAEKPIRACSGGPNPGCFAGQVKDCIFPKRPGGYFVQKSRSMMEFSTTSPTKYSEEYEMDSPGKVCVKITQSTGACEQSHCAQGRLTANETFPRAVDE